MLIILFQNNEISCGHISHTGLQNSEWVLCSQ